MVRVAGPLKCPLSTRRRFRYPALLLVAASVVLSSDPVTGYTSNYCIRLRGGTKEEDIALDAFIDELIASVEDEPRLEGVKGEIETSPLDSSEIDKPNRLKKRRKLKKRKKAAESETDDSPGSVEDAIVDAQLEHANDDDECVTVDLPLQKDERESVSNATMFRKEIEKGDDEEAIELQVDPQKDNDRQSNIDVESLGDQRVSEMNNEDKPQETKQFTRQFSPPNALYRFFLDLGIVGQILALFLMLITEWLHVYVPFFATFLSSLSSYLFPQRKLDNRVKRNGQPLSQYASSAVSSRRTGQTSRERRKLTKQADKIALDQLKRVGNVQEAKYRYVSDAFLARHGLGTSVTSQTNITNTEKATEQQDTQKGRQTKVPDEDWVLNALTKDTPTKDDRPPSTTPNLSVDVNTNGFSAGVGFSIGFDSKQRIKVAKAALMPRDKRKSASSRVSDRDGFLGRIRAAAGANSKSLLGAYPGDAVSLDEAGDSRGVLDLARRYGWGDWEEDDDVMLSSFSPRSRKKSTRKRRTPSIPIRQTEDGVDGGVNHQQSTVASKRKSRRNTLREENSTQPNLRDIVAHKTRRSLPRDPLKRILEVQGESKQDD